MRFAMYAGASMVLATGVILRALHQRANFYSATVYLAQSNACLMILTNLALLTVASFMLGLQRLFFGTLRPIEVEQLYEKGWFAITETCLAMTIFREEVGAYFLVMFVCLLIGKVWGWIGEGRVEILEQQPPTNPHMFHLRLSMSLIISTLFDMYMLLYSVQTVLQQARPNMMVVFAFEFAVLHVTSLSTAARYTISLYEASVIKSQTKHRREQIRQERMQARRQAAEANTTEAAPNSTNIVDDSDVDSLDIDVPGWEEKGRWVFYLDLTTDFFKLILYLTFFCVLCMFYGMPIHIIRDVALTIRSFYKRINDFVRYRQATKDMNSRYPDATPEEVAREDVCIICREDMRAWGPATQDENASERPARTALDERTRPKKLPCGHILHFACLRSWLERQQSCPTCRRPVLVQGTSGPTYNVNGAGQNAGVGPQHNQQQVPNAGHGAVQQPVIAHNVFNFGPFRLAFGARIGGQGLQPHLNNEPAIPNQQAQAVNPQGAGTGFGLFRPPQQRTTATFTPMNVPAQLQQIEQQLTRDINALRVQSDQLYLVQSLQRELGRLQSQHTWEQMNQMPNSILGHPQPQGLVHQQMPQDSQTLTTPRVFTSNAQQLPLGPGHSELPPGMTLPEGWTILPLQRINQINPTTQHPASHSQDFSVPTPTPGPSLPRNLTNNANSSLNPSSLPVTTPIGQDGEQLTGVPVSEPITNGRTSPSLRHLSSEANNAAEPESTDHAVIEQPSTALSSNSIPNWGSASAPQSVSTQNVGNDIATSTHESANSNSRVVDGSEETEYSTEDRRASKGKGRAVTVEDSVDDVD